VDGRKLWPIPQVRPLRFHDLRHSTVSLLLLTGVPPVVDQRVLRHKDPKLTERVYGHLTPGFLRAEVGRLRFLPVVQELPRDEVHALAAGGESLGPSLVQAVEEGSEEARPTEANPVAAWALGEARSTGLEPVTSGVTGRRSNQLN